MFYALDLFLTYYIRYIIEITIARCLLKMFCLLTRNVPQLQTNDSPMIPVQDFESKVNTNSCAVMLRKNLMDITLYNRRFPDT